MPAEFENHSVRELLQLNGRVIAELRARQVVRTGNAPLGDYAEWLFARACGWALAQNSAAGYDATAPDGERYQIKARRLSATGKGSRQLGTIRNLEAGNFSQLAAVLFDEAYGVWRAALIPRAVVAARATKTPHVNGWRFILDDAVWALPGVVDVTDALRKAEAGDVRAAAVGTITASPQQEIPDQL